MRPVNLIPAGERRGTSAPSRTGSAAYVLVAALVLLVCGVVALVMTKNDVATSQAEVNRLEQEKVTATAEATKLAPYTAFKSVRDTRATTVATLAGTRFDWERVMRELAVVLPGDVWIKQLTATVAPTVTIDGGAQIESRKQVLGPAIEMVGCGMNQDAVATFMSSLRDIDGVTRVGLQKSGKDDEDSGAAVSAPTDGSDSTKCPVAGQIVTFEVVIAFDDAPAAIAQSAAVAGASAAQEPDIGATGTTGASGTSGATGSTDASGVAETTAEQQSGTNSAETQIQKAKNQKSAILGGEN